MKAILFPLLTICQYKKKSLLDFHYWILSTPAWEHSPRIKEQMAHIMGVPKQLKQLPTLQTSFVLLHQRSAHCDSGAQDTSESSRPAHSPALPHAEASAHPAGAALLLPPFLAQAPSTALLPGQRLHCFQQQQLPRRASCCSSREIQVLSEPPARRAQTLNDIRAKAWHQEKCTQLREPETWIQLLKQKESSQSAKLLQNNYQH